MREKILKIYIDSPYRASMHSFDNSKIYNELKKKEKFFSNDLGKLLIKENSIIREYKNFITHLKYCNKNTTYLYTILSSKLNSDSEDKRKEYFYYYWDCLKNNSYYFQTIFDKLDRKSVV